MAKKEKIQKKFSLYALFGKIGDILFIPILVISLFSSVSMLVQRKQNKPTSFFGVSLVNVLSKSMTSAGFLKGDTVLTVNASENNIELGDIIAFYRFTDELDKSTTKTNIVRYIYSSGKELNTDNIDGDLSQKNEIISRLNKTDRENEKTIEDAQKAKAPIYFHMVIGIAHDEYGNVFYRTKGTDNGYFDTYNGLGYVRSDFVVGKYVNTPRFVRDAMSFCASTRGMIIMVCLPLSLLVLLQCLSLIKQIEVMNLEKQLLNGKKRFYDEEIRTNLTCNDLETYTKSILYTLVPANEREYLMNYMWEDVIGSGKVSKKEKRLYDLALEANDKLDKSSKAYFQTWINGTKGFTKKKIKKHYENNTLTLILANSNSEAEVKDQKLNNNTINKTIAPQNTTGSATKKKTQKTNAESIALAIEKANKEQQAKVGSSVKAKTTNATTQKTTVKQVASTTEQKTAATKSTQTATQVVSTKPTSKSVSEEIKIKAPVKKAPTAKPAVKAEDNKLATKASSKAKVAETTNTQPTPKVDKVKTNTQTATKESAATTKKTSGQSVKASNSMGAKPKTVVKSTASTSKTTSLKSAATTSTSETKPKTAAKTSASKSPAAKPALNAVSTDKKPTVKKAPVKTVPKKQEENLAAKTVAKKAPTKVASKPKKD